MRFFLFIALLGVFFAPVVAHAAQDGKDAVRGCDWQGVVEQIGQHNGEPALALKLSNMKGSCMSEPGSCGKPKDVVFAPITESEIEGYEVGQKVDVWVTGQEASVTIPPCAEALLDNNQ